MAYLKKKALFFTTSPRTPSKMIPEIQLLAETFSGREWNKQSQIEFTELLTKLRKLGDYAVKRLGCCEAQCW